MRYIVLLLALLVLPAAAGAELAPIRNVESQPFKAQVRRVVAALEFLGEQLTGGEQAAIDAALDETDEAKAVLAIQKTLAPRVIAAVHINPESRVKVARGDAAAALNEQGWSVFLVRVHNEGGVTAKLRVSSPNAQPLYRRSSGKPDPVLNITPKDVPDRWLDVELFEKQPLIDRLSGLLVEYRIIQLYSRDKGNREATLAFDVRSGHARSWFSQSSPNSVPLQTCRPSAIGCA